MILPIRKEVFNIYFIVMLLSIFVCCLSNAASENIAKGIINVDGQKVKINHAIARPLFDDIIIVLTDNAVPKEQVPDGIMGLSEEGKIRGIMFSVSAKNKRLLGKGESIQSLHFYPVWEQLGIIGNGEFQLFDSEENIIKGRIYTPSNNEWGEHIYSYDIQFTADIKKEPVKVKVTGASDAPSKAFSKYYSAVMAGNLAELKKYIAKDRLDEIGEESGMLEFFIEMQQAMSPTDVEIVSSIVKQDSAFLKVEGNRGADNSEGNIEMIKEDGTWKVNLESWVSGEVN